MCGITLSSPHSKTENLPHITLVITKLQLSDFVDLKKTVCDLLLADGKKLS